MNYQTKTSFLLIIYIFQVIAEKAEAEVERI